MSSFMEGYGETEARRGRILKRIAIVTLVAAIVGTSGYFYFRTFFQKRVAARFIDTVEAQDLDAGYSMWCPAETPCRFYSRERYERDFGPEGTYRNIADAKTRYVDYCDSGVVLSYEYPGSSDLLALWVDRSTGIVSFAPWPRCPGRHLQLTGLWDRLFGSSQPPQLPSP